MSASLPDALTPGSVFSWQAQEEARLNRILERETASAMNRIVDKVMRGNLTQAMCNDEWQLAVINTLDELGYDLTADETWNLREGLLSSELGQEAYRSAFRVMTEHNAALATKDDLRAALTEALGLETPSLVASAADIVKKVDRWATKLLKPALRVGQAWKVRIKREVRSSFTGLTGTLVLARMRREGVSHKMWVCRHDDKVRSSHLEADGQVVPLNQPFRVGSALLQHPGEAEGDYEEIVNCRCIIVPARDVSE